MGSKGQVMRNADDFIAGFMWDLETRHESDCKSVLSDALPPETRVLSILRSEICPGEACSDVDRAIIGASLGG